MISTRNERSGAPATRPLPRLATALALTLLLARCGAAEVAPAAAPQARPSARVDVAPVVFSVTLPGGVALGMDASGRIARGGAPLASLEADGRLVDARGRSIATLLSDGQLAHRGALSPLRIHEAMPSALGGSRETVLREGAIDVLSLAGSRLRVVPRGRWPGGEVEVTLAPDATDAARVAVILAVALELLERPAAPPVVRADPTSPLPAPPVPPDVAAPPPHAQRTASGLASIVVRPGHGTAHPTATSVVSVHYTGWTVAGRMFDTSSARGAPAEFPLNRVIAGWTEGVQLMVEGEVRRFWMPGALAYGDEPRAGRPTGMLVFEIELLRIVR